MTGYIAYKQLREMKEKKDFIERVYKYNKGSLLEDMLEMPLREIVFNDKKIDVSRGSVYTKHNLTLDLVNKVDEYITKFNMGYVDQDVTLKEAIEGIIRHNPKN